MAGKTAATSCSEATATIMWIRDSVIVKVVEQNERGEDIKTISCSSCCGEQKKASGDNDKISIVEEGYAGVGKPEKVEVIHLTNPKTTRSPGDCPDGVLCVDEKDPLFGCSVKPPQETAAGSSADQFIMYELEIPNLPRDRNQPKIILLESQMKGLNHYFLRRSWPGLSVMCQHMEKYDDKKGPQVDINDASDQRFVWVIPIDRDESNEFSLKPFDKSYYLACKEASGAAILCKGGAKDLEKYSNFKLKYLQ